MNIRFEIPWMNLSPPYDDRWRRYYFHWGRAPGYRILSIGNLLVFQLRFRRDPYTRAPPSIYILGLSIRTRPHAPKHNSPKRP